METGGECAQISADAPWLDLLGKILEQGEDIHGERTGTGTRSLFGPQIEFSPRCSGLLQTKKVLWKKSLEELLWMIRGETSNGILRGRGVGFWSANCERDFLDKRGLTEYQADEDLGPIYGHQWRNFNGTYVPSNRTHDEIRMGVDQIRDVLHTLAHNKHCRRMIVSAWNPEQLSQMALPPCHVLFQFSVSSDDHLHCKLYQRSADMFLGVPFNMFNYMLLVKIIAHALHLKPGRFIHTFGDAHIYLNHIKQVHTVLNRATEASRLPAPSVTITKMPPIDPKDTASVVQWMESLTCDDFKVDYQSMSYIAAPMSQ